MKLNEDALRKILRYARKHDGPWNEVESEATIPDERDAYDLARVYEYKGELKRIRDEINSMGKLYENQEK